MMWLHATFAMLWTLVAKSWMRKRFMAGMWLFCNMKSFCDFKNSCMEHTVHLMACHFVKALGIPLLRQSRQQVHSSTEDEFNVDTSTEIEASVDDTEAIQAASITEFDAGDVVSKLMAFVSQLRLCSEDTRDYLIQLAVLNGGPSWKIKLWVRTHWGSLSDCFCTVLAIRKVCSFVILNCNNSTNIKLRGH